MKNYQFTNYFEEVVLVKRPYIKVEWCIKVVSDPDKSEQQLDGRYRFWKKIPEFENRYLRVITLEDKITIHNAFPDRRFTL